MNKFKALFWQGDFEQYYPGHQFSEIFKDRIYAPYLEGKTDAVVIDVGGNIGSFTLYASKYAKHVYTVEPSQEHIDCITEMVKFNEMENVTVAKYAIANTEGTMALRHPINKTMYSLLPTGIPETGSEEVEAITIETLFTKYNIEKCDLLKLDTEGSEFEILGGSAFKNIASKIKTIVLESHTWANRNPNQIRDSLQANGFTVTQIQGEASLWTGTR